MYSASAGSAIGPPWQSTMTSLRTRFAAAAQASIFGTQPSSVSAVSAPMLPPVVRPEVADDDVGAGARHRLRLFLVEDVGRGEEVQLVGGADHVDLEPVAHAGLLEVGAEDAVDEAHGGEVLHAGEAELAQLAQELRRGS